MLDYGALVTGSIHDHKFLSFFLLQHLFKSTLLRVAHGDIYTKDKLHRFGLIDSNKCPRCDSQVTLEHKFITCEYAARIWQVVGTLERKILGDSAATANK